MKLFSPASANTKTAKNLQFDNILSFIMHLAPSTLSGYNVCPKASTGCAAACLNTAGRGAFNSVQLARVNKTKRLFEDKINFLSDLVKDCIAVERKAIKLNKKGVIRLNGTSDIQWERVKIKDDKNIFELFPNIQFYDYTKIMTRFLQPMPTNYHLTFSASESNWDACASLLDSGVNVAVVFNSIPETYEGYQCIDGDSHDLRFLDKQGGYIVALKAKGRARKDSSGFVK